jgi:hypothetical protein
MTAPLLELADHDTAIHHTLADSVGDAALAALLRSKPHDEAIPASVWWLIAETLRTSVTVRRTMTTGGSQGERDDLPMLVTEATLLAEAALAELAEATGARPTPISVPAVPHHSGRAAAHSGRAAATRPVFGLHLSVLFLARLLVSHRTTTPQRLANTVSAHVRALAALGVERGR